MMYLRTLVAAVLSLVSSGAAAAALYDTTNVFEVAYGEDITVDGDVTKAAWQNVPAVGSFSHKGTAGTSGPYRTDVRLRYSKTALYLAGTFWQPMDEILAQYDQNDLNIWEDDCLEMFLVVPAKNGPQLCHFAVNALGSVYEAKEGKKSWWVPGRRVAAKRLGDRWTFEMKLPYAGLGIERPFAGDALGVRFCRTVHKPKTDVVTAPHMDEDAHHVRKHFAKLSFGPPEGSDAETLVAEAEAYRKSAAAKRLADLTEETEAMLAGLEASVSLFRKKKSPVYAAACDEIAKMRVAYDAFREKKGDIVVRLEKLGGLLDGFRQAASQAAYVVWETDKWACGSPSDLPPPDVSETPLLRFEQAGNEREAVCLCFAGLLAGPRLDLRIVPETFWDKDRFVRHDRFEVYEEPYVLYDSQLVTAPLVKKDGNAVTLTPGHPVRVWIVFNSRGVKPGTYPMSIKLKPANDANVAVRTLKANVRVWNFSLPETHEWPLPSFFWGPDLHVTDEAATLRLMHDYHVTHGWTRGRCYGFGVTEGDGLAAPRKKFEQDFDPELAATANQEFFDTAKELKMKFVFGWTTPFAPEWFQLMSDRLTKMGFGYDDFIFKSLIMDEFRKKDIEPTAAARARVAAWPGSEKWWFQNVYLSTPPPSGATMEDIEAAKLPEFYKQWTLIHSLVKDPKRGPDVIRRLRTKGCKVWSYKCRTCMQRQGVLDYYRLWLWDCYLSGLDGAAMWCSGTAKGSDGFDASDGYDDGILWEGNDLKMITTKRFEAFREGLEDIAYMDLLKKAQAELKAAGKTEDTEAAALLADCRNVQKSNDQQKVDAWRLAAGRTVDRLSRK